MPELHSAFCQPEGKLTQVEVRGLRRDGECRGLGKHLTTNYGCGTDGRPIIHLLEGFPVAVHVSLEKGTMRWKKNTLQRERKQNTNIKTDTPTPIFMFPNVRFLPPWVVLQGSTLWHWQTLEKHSEWGSELGHQERNHHQDRSGTGHHWWCDGGAELQAHPRILYGPGHLMMMMMCKWVLKFSKGWSMLLRQFHHCHQRLMVVSHCECSPHRSSGAFDRQSNTAKRLQEGCGCSNFQMYLTCTHTRLMQG